MKTMWRFDCGGEESELPASFVLDRPIVARVIRMAVIIFKTIFIGWIPHREKPVRL